MSSRDPHSPIPGMTARDFERLCRSVDESIGQFSVIVGEGTKRAGEALDAAMRRRADAAGSGAPGFAGSAAAWQFPVKAPKRFRSTAGLSVSGWAMAVTGGAGVLLFGLGALVVSLTPLLVTGMLWTVGLIAGAVLTALSAVLLAFGVKRLGVARRCKSFRRIFANREICSFEELAGKSQMSEAQARSVARKMLKHGLLPEGRIDDEGLWLMTSDAAYDRYLQAQASYQQKVLEQRNAEAARNRTKSRSASDPLPEEARTLIAQGNDFLQQVRALDVSIDDREVSQKIVAIEGAVERILKRVQDDPDVVDSLDRFADYYLPTTVRLLAAYDDLEAQLVQGENIAASKNEIEHTLDVLHAAFEKLLDDTYRDLSLDVSSDIAVLHAVLAQEGLADNPFDGRTDHSSNKDNAAPSS